MNATAMFRKRWLWPLGGLVLALGLLVYLSDRPAGHASLLPRAWALRGQPLWGPLGQWLPSFAHTFSFSLFSAAVLPGRARPRYDARGVWMVINLAFEFGQHTMFKPALETALRDGLGPLALLRPLALYGLRGTFDPGDIAAVVLGAAAAALVLHRLDVTQETRHGC